MKYTQFEQLVIGAGAVTIAATVVVSLAGNGLSDWPSLIAQLMLLPVLIVAVHYGRKAGLLAALLASAVFIVLQIPALSAPEGLSPSEVGLIAFSIAAFGLVGIVGGDLCGRVKYVFARYNQSESIDDWSHVYNQRRAAELLASARERFARYGEPFSVVVIAQTPSPDADPRPTRRRALVRAVADHLRGDIRMVDEVARLDDGRFLVILPHTDRQGGVIVAERLTEGVRQLHGEDGAVSGQCFSAEEDELELGSLANGIMPKQADYSGSTA